MDWIDVAYDRNRWQAIVNAVMNLLDSVQRGELLDEPRTGQLLKDSAPWGQQVSE